MGLELLIIGAAVAGTAVAASQTGKDGGGSSSIKMPTATAPGNIQKTAAPAIGTPATEQERMNRRLAASQLTKDWGGLKLSKPGLLGLGATQ